jgi:hypothetical protein
MTGEGRIYGGGLHKLEPRELANVPMDGIEDILPRLVHISEQMHFAYPNATENVAALAV